MLTTGNYCRERFGGGGADGAGSASQGKVGAMVAVETAIESLSLRDITRDSLADDETVRSLLTEALLAAKKAVEDEAVACQKQPQDLATTLIIAIASPEMVALHKSVMGWQ